MFDRERNMDSLAIDIASCLRRELANVYGGDIDFAARSHLSEERIEEQVDALKLYAPTLAEGVKLLEIGCGFGAFVNMTNWKYGFDTYGVDTDFQRLECAKRLAGAHGHPQRPLAKSVGEALPFPDNTFDVVYSTNVLEHVRDPEKVFNEGLRVLKTNGYAQYVAPNYGSFWDGHYALPWIPYAPKNLMKAYVRILGRDPNYIDSLRLINIGALRGILARTKYRVKVISWGDQVFQKRLADLSFKEHAGMEGLGSIVKLIGSAGLAPLAQWLSKRLVLYTPFVLTLRKDG